jgi:hypothetical protein
LKKTQIKNRNLFILGPFIYLCSMPYALCAF